MTVNSQLVEKLKSEGHYYAAGTLAASLGLPNSYGCHYGMRSDKQAAQISFERGHRNFHRDAERN